MSTKISNTDSETFMLPIDINKYGGLAFDNEELEIRITNDFIEVSGQQDWRMCSGGADRASFQLRHVLPLYIDPNAVLCRLMNDSTTILVTAPYLSLVSKLTHHNRPAVDYVLGLDSKGIQYLKRYNTKNVKPNAKPNAKPNGKANAKHAVKSSKTTKEQEDRFLQGLIKDPNSTANSQMFASKQSSRNLVERLMNGQLQQAAAAAADAANDHKIHLDVKDLLETVKRAESGRSRKGAAKKANESKNESKNEPKNEPKNGDDGSKKENKRKRRTKRRRNAKAADQATNATPEGTDSNKSATEASKTGEVPEIVAEIVPEKVEKKREEHKSEKSASVEQKKEESKEEEPKLVEKKREEPKPQRPLRGRLSRSEAPRNEVAQIKPVETGPAKTEPSKTGSGKTEPAKTESAKTEPAKTESGKSEPAKTEPAKTESGKTEPAKTEVPQTEKPKVVVNEKSESFAVASGQKQDEPVHVTSSTDKQLTVEESPKQSRSRSVPGVLGDSPKIDLILNQSSSLGETALNMNVAGLFAKLLNYEAAGRTASDVPAGRKKKSESESEAQHKPLKSNLSRPGRSTEQLNSSKTEKHVMIADF